jgi:hypothetical protein
MTPRIPPDYGILSHLLCQDFMAGMVSKQKEVTVCGSPLPRLCGFYVANLPKSVVLEYLLLSQLDRERCIRGEVRKRLGNNSHLCSPLPDTAAAEKRNEAGRIGKTVPPPPPRMEIITAA